MSEPLTHVERLLIQDIVANFSVTEDWIMRAIDDPHWRGASPYGDWRYFVPSTLRDHWDHLSLEARLAGLCAGLEKADSVNAD